MRILIVEDEKKLSDILQRSLKSEGYMVDGVHTAADGLEYAKTYHYDLLIIDLQIIAAATARAVAAPRAIRQRPSKQECCRS
jgi:DNA-binding response OmpR family regulator